MKEESKRRFDDGYIQIYRMVIAGMLAVIGFFSQSAFSDLQKTDAKVVASLNAIERHQSDLARKYARAVLFEYVALDYVVVKIAGETILLKRVILNQASPAVVKGVVHDKDEKL